MIDFSNTRNIVTPKGEVAMIARGDEILWRKQKYKCQVEYLESTGTQYIDTGVTGNVNTKIDVQFSKKNAETSYSIYGVVGARGSSASVNNIVVGLSSTQIALDFNNSRYATYRYIARDTLEDTIYRAVVSKEARQLFLNNALIGQNTALCTDNIRTSNLWLFKVENYGATNAKIYYCKIYDNGNLVRDFSPVLDWNDVPCMYDEMTDELFYNQGTGGFLYG